MRSITGFSKRIPPSACKRGSRTPSDAKSREIAPDHEEHWYELYGQMPSRDDHSVFKNPRTLWAAFTMCTRFALETRRSEGGCVVSRHHGPQAGRNALKDADRRKDEFLATLAHELRNPLAPICTALEMLKMAEDKTVLFDEVYGTLERQTQHLVRLIDDLLDVSRITRGKLELRKSLIPLSEVVKAAVEESKPLIDEAGHEFKVAVPKEPIFLDADPHRLAQVLSNLLNNAAKYTPRGGRVEFWRRNTTVRFCSGERQRRGHPSGNAGSSV